MCITSLPRDLHAEITQQLIAAIDANPQDPQLPWRSAGSTLSTPTNVLTGYAYQSINILNLWVSAHHSGYDLPVWGTYCQWAECGAQVRRRERSSLIILYKEFETELAKNRRQTARALAGLELRS